MSQTEEYTKRLKIVRAWLRASDWTPDTPASFDYDPIVDRAFARWYKHRDRARQLVAKASRQLRGEHVQTGGGRPRTSLTLHDGQPNIRAAFHNAEQGHAMQSVDVRVDKRGPNMDQIALQFEDGWRIVIQRVDPE